MSVTIRDVAAHADVSIATVSRALRGHTAVSPDTRLKVQVAADTLGYSLPSRDSNADVRTTRIAVVMPHVGRWYFSRVLEGIEHVVTDKEADVLLFRPFDRRAGRRNLIDAVAGKSVDAVIVVSLSVSAEDMSALLDRGIATCLLGTESPNVSSVRIDDVDTTSQMTRHLLNLGHRRIGLVSSAPSDPIPSQVARDRRLGYETSLREAGLEPDSRLITAADFSIRGAQSAFDRLFASDNPPTAIVAESDELAFGILSAARQHGLRVPDDLSIGGVDDHDLADVMGLTTIAQPVTALGEVAAWQVLGAQDQPAHIVMPTALVIRNSTCELVQ